MVRGGYLFEYFLLTCSGYSDNRRFRRVAHARRHFDDKYIGHDEEAYFIQATGSKFAGWLLLHIANLGTNGREQMFYMTMAMHYHGLSRQGIEMLAKYGFSTNLTRFDDMRRICLLKSRTETRYVVIYNELLLDVLLITIWASSAKHPHTPRCEDSSCLPP